MDDFVQAPDEVVPAFGASTGDLQRCRLNGIVDCGDRHKNISERIMSLVEQVKVSRGSPLLTCLFEGPSGRIVLDSGKTALAATAGIDSDFPYVKIVSAETMIGLHENTKCAHIFKVFEDAYKSPLNIIILDDIERATTKGNKLLIIGTTSEVGFLDSIAIRKAFSVTYHVPNLQREDAKRVLEHLDVFAEEDASAAAETLTDMPIKKLYTLIEMAAEGENGRSAEAVYSGKEKIQTGNIYVRLQDVVIYR